MFFLCAIFVTTLDGRQFSKEVPTTRSSSYDAMLTTVAISN